MMPNLPSLEERIKRLLELVGEPRTCRGCGAPMFMVRHRNGKLAPYTADGLNHFVNCPQAAMFRAGKDGE